MLRKLVLLGLALVVLLSAVSWKPAGSALPILTWTQQADAEREPAARERAILIELGIKDAEPLDWSGRYELVHCQLVQKLSYSFRGKLDRWLDENRFQVQSYRLAKWFDKDHKPVLPVGLVLQVLPGTDARIKFETVRGKFEVPVNDLKVGDAREFLDGQVRVALVTHSTEIASTDTEDDFPAAAVGPDGAVHVVYNSYSLSDLRRREDYAQIKQEPQDFAEYAAPVLGDQLWLRSLRNGTWSVPVALTPARQDLGRPAVTATEDGTVWIAYSAQRDGNFDVYVKPYRPGQIGEEQRISTSSGPDVDPVLTTDLQGRPWLAWQGAAEGRSRIFVTQRTEAGWQPAEAISHAHEGNAWQPALAAGPDGSVAVAWDQYRSGDYDVLLRIHGSDGKWADPVAIASSPRFEARPSLAVDGQGRWWIAYEEGPEKWGKDYGALDEQDGKGLYHGHQVQVRCWSAGKLTQPVAPLPKGEPNEANRRLDGPQYSHPRIAIDLQGQVWLTYRQSFGSRYHTKVGPYWMSFVRCLQGGAWTGPVLVHRSDAGLDYRSVLLPRPGQGLRIVFSADSRFQNPDQFGNDIFFASLPSPAATSVEPQMQAATPGDKDPQQFASEREDVQAIRAYRVHVNGKELRLLRGEFHRHTEISWDGRPDGSLLDMYRYAIDAAAMDWIGNGDHDHGAGREYPWWLTQKYNDMHQQGSHFLTMFTYERSVAYPHGHRNALLATRGIRTLPRLVDAQGKVSDNDTKMFYRYLKQFNGICASHTSATNMGTDWRDYDPIAEPIVEIYQGDRNSYEYPGAPRSGTEQTSLGGWQPKGYVNLALEAGLKLGFQSSSDHYSTHISYCVAAAEEPTRQGILKALQQRHCYGATDNILLDVQSRDGQHFMGDEFETQMPPGLKFFVRGTAKITQLDVLRDSQVVQTFRPDAVTYEGTWTDPQPLREGTHYYYVRVLQANDEIAWGSPMYVRFRP